MRSCCFVAAAAGSERERRNSTSGATAENTTSDAANASEAQDYMEDKTRQDKTRRAKPSTPHLAQPTEQDGQNTTVQDNDPRLGCIECWLWKTRQDKTRRMKHDTGHLAQPQRWPPRMCAAKQGTLRLRTAKHGTLHLAQPQITAVDAANASEVQDYGRQDKR